MHFAKVYERLEKEGPLETENMTHLTTQNKFGDFSINELAESMF